MLTTVTLEQDIENFGLFYHNYSSVTINLGTKYNKEFHIFCEPICEV